MMLDGRAGWLLVLGLLACGSQNAADRGTAAGGGSGGAAHTSDRASSGSGFVMGGKSASRGGASTGGATGAGGVVGGATSTASEATGGGSAGRDSSAERTGGTSAWAGSTALGGGGGSGGASGRDAGASGSSASRPDASIGDASPPFRDAADATAVVTCSGSSTLKAGNNKATLQFGGRTRSYVVYVPSSLKAGSPAPLVFDFHGHGGNASQEASASGWNKKADQVGLLVVYPEGVDSSWNVGNCCGLAMSEKVDDVGFTRAIIEAVSKATCIDSKRVYATGMSNGAGFVHRLGCEAAEVIAAIAPASADLVTDPCTPARPISVLAVRGLTDTMVKYEGGKTGSTGWLDPGAKESLELWKKIDGCTGSPTTSLQYCESYTQCSAGVENTLCSLPNTGHDTYNNAVKMSVPDVAWEMFQRQPMP